MAKRIVIVDDDRSLTEAYVQCPALEGLRRSSHQIGVAVQEATPEEKNTEGGMFIVGSRDASGKSFPGDECSGGTFTGFSSLTI